MATAKATADFVTDSLPPPRFALRAMFGEYALYADGKVVALLCDDRLFVKVHAATATLADCEQGPPYPGAKPHYLVDEGHFAQPEFRALLLGLAKALPPTKKARPAGKKAAAKRAAKKPAAKTRD